MILLNTKLLNINNILILLIFILIVFNENLIQKINLIEQTNLTETKSFIIESFCKCSNSYKEYILVNKNILRDFLSVILIREKNGSINSNKYLYSINENEFKKSSKTCDLYNVLRRGKHQKVISYSLYGSNTKYYQNLEEIAKLIRIKYPNYTSRVYYDKTVPKDIRCKLECQYGDVIDFCNIDKFTTDLIIYKFNENNPIDISYMHRSMWRFLAIGDSFVDVFMSRDTDSFFTDREIDSVNDWLNSRKIGHIMRGILYRFRLTNDQ